MENIFYYSSINLLSARYKIKELLDKKKNLCWYPYDLHLNSILYQDFLYKKIKSKINNNIEFDTAIFHCNPIVWFNYLEKFKVKFIGKRLIGYTFWEIGDPPIEWIKIINVMDELWVPFKWCKYVFEKNLVTIPIKISPILYTDKSNKDLYNNTYNREWKSNFDIIGFKKAEKYIKKNINIPIEQQTKYKVKEFKLDYSQNKFCFNSCIFEHYNNKYLITRKHYELTDKTYNNSLEVYNLSLNLKTEDKFVLKIKNDVVNEQYEDPRAIFFNDQIIVGCANYQKNNVKFIHQKILIFDNKWNYIKNINPIYGGNGPSTNSNEAHQKNWIYFIYDNKLYCVYSIYPHIIIEIDIISGKVISEYKTFFDVYKKWKCGIPRNGTPPILYNNYYYSFFHSSLPWKYPKRQYFMGWYKFNCKPPFNIIDISEMPVLCGNEKDKRILVNQSPLVVFPCGAIIDKNNFVVSFGINDERSGYIKIPIKDIK